MKRISSIAPFAAAAALGACSMATTTPLGPSSAPPAQGAMVYSLPKALVTGMITRDAAGVVATVEFGQAKTIRDPAHQYVLDYTSSPLSDDELTVVTEEGFLSGVTAIATDKTFEAAQELAKGTGLLSSDEKKRGADEIKFTFDPHSELEAENARLAAQNVDLVFSCPDCAPPAKAGPPVEGFYVRPTTDVVIYARRADGFLVASHAMSSPNGSRLVAMPLNRSIGVERKTTYSAFDNGEPTNVKLEKPSEALGVVTGVVGVVGAVVAAPVVAAGEALNEVNADAALVDAQVKLTEAEARLKEAEAGRLTAVAQLRELENASAGEQKEESEDEGEEDLGGTKIPTGGAGG